MALWGALAPRLSGPLFFRTQRRQCVAYCFLAAVRVCSLSLLLSLFQGTRGGRGTAQAKLFSAWKQVSKDKCLPFEGGVWECGKPKSNWHPPPRKTSMRSEARHSPSLRAVGSVPPCPRSKGSAAGLRRGLFRGRPAGCLAGCAASPLRPEFGRACVRASERACLLLSE